MKIPRTVNAIGQIDDDLIAAAAGGKKQTRPWLKWSCAAACFALLIIAGTVLLPSLFDGDLRYKHYQIHAGESVIEWPWEYKTAYEKYTELTLNGSVYRSKYRAVSKNFVSDLIGTYTVAGYDMLADKKHTKGFEVYRLKHAAESQYVAVRMDSVYYVFQNSKHALPDTLGELLDLVDLPNAVELRRFSENGDGPDKKHYALSRDDGIWDVLAGCKEASFTEDEKFSLYDGRDYIGFSITSETLGVYRKSFCVTGDGYLWTNALESGYLFHIGTEAAEKIIRFAKENSAEVPYEPYVNSVSGIIAEITDEYIIVDDSILCWIPAAGIRYKVMLNDLRLSRYVDHSVIKVGDTVQVSYTGQIDAENCHTIDSAVSIDLAVISGGSILIPE